MSSEATVLGVTLNRDRLNQALTPASFESDGDFVVVLRNEGEPVHVHLRFGGPLAAATSVSASNHFVDADATRRVRVSVAAADDPVEGTLEVVLGHGAAGTEVPVTLTPGRTSVAVDESLATPASAGAGPADPDAVSTAAVDTDTSGPDVEPERDGGLPGNVTATAADRLREAPPDPATLAVVGVAAAALVGALVVVLAFDSLAVSLGVAAVVVAVAVALWLLVE